MFRPESGATPRPMEGGDGWDGSVRDRLGTFGVIVRPVDGAAVGGGVRVTVMPPPERGGVGAVREMFGAPPLRSTCGVGSVIGRLTYSVFGAVPRSTCGVGRPLSGGPSRPGPRVTSLAPSRPEGKDCSRSAARRFSVLRRSDMVVCSVRDWLV